MGDSHRIKDAAAYKLTTEQVAEKIGIKARTVAKYATKPSDDPIHLPGVKRNREWRFREADVSDWFERNTEPPSRT